MIYLCLQENEIFQKTIMYFWICQYGISCVICANSVRNKNKYHLSFSCAQHGLHDVVVGFRRSLWLSGIITLLNFTFKKLVSPGLVRNCLDSLEGKLLCPRPWGRYVVLYGYKETKIYTWRYQIKESTVALEAIQLKLFNSLERKLNHSLF